VDRPDREAQRLIDQADRLDELADTAELMGDDPTATRLHDEAARRREHAFARLDETGPG
jgi:hypothetical protein